MTQATLAKLARLSTTGLNNIEKGNADPKASTLRAIEQALTSAGVEFIDDARGEGVLKLRLPARRAATEAEMQASADDVRSQAAVAVDEVLSGSDATAQQKAERRGTLTDEPAVVGRARGKGRTRPSTKE